MRYRSSVDFIGQGFESCWLNALDLIGAAKRMQDEKLNGVALSLSVLAMEEIGKIMLIDGLLFARPGDERSKGFEKGHLKHTVKLAALDYFPYMVTYMATLDPRWKIDKAFHITLATVLQSYKLERQALAQWLGSECSLQDLDIWKQRGFYAHLDLDKCRCVRPAQSDAGLSAAVVTLAARIVDTVDFLLKRSIDRYKEWTRWSRLNISEEQLLEIRKLAQASFEPDGEDEA